MFDFATFRIVPLRIVLAALVTCVSIAEAAGKQYANLTLIPSVKQVVPGSPFDVCIRFGLKDGWHIYWKNGGDAGVPPKVQWTLPDGFQAGPLQFPAPKSYVDAGGLTSFIHDGTPLFVVRIDPPTAISRSKVNLAVKGKYLICKDKCIWQDIDLDLDLPVAKPGSGPELANEKVFATARRAQPRSESKYVRINPTVSTSSFAEGSTFDLIVQLEIKAKHHIQSHTPTKESLVRCELFVAPTPGVYFESPVYPKGEIRKVASLGELSEYAGTVSIRVPAEVDAVPDPPVFGGVLRFQACSDKGTCFPPENLAFELDLTRKASAAGGDGTTETVLPPTKSAPATTIEEAGLSDTGNALDDFFGRFGLAGLLAGCFLFGLAINATPCVLPLLSIKVLGFVQQAHESRRRTLALGLSFGAGVMIFFVLLGFLAASGKNILQYPVAVIALSGVVMAMALSMLGVFSLSVPTAATQLEAGIKQEGAWASFGKGALAPVLGLACTGPMLASAFALATQQPPRIAIMGFLSAGLGMASPYILLGANPNWLSFLPRPGNWMITFERIVGFLLLLMVIWLLHPLVPQIGAEGLEWTLGFFVMVAMACWVLGQVNVTMPASARWKYRGTAVALIAASAALVYGWIYPLDAAIARQRRLLAQQTGAKAVDWNSEIPWRAWSHEAVKSELQAGNGVFVDFTAAWCTVCKANKKIATNTLEVRKKMQSCGIVPFMADFTLEDQDMAEAMQSFGRAGPPLNLVYRSAAPSDPIVLRPNLTQAYLLEQLDSACPASSDETEG